MSYGQMTIHKKVALSLVELIISLVILLVISAPLIATLKVSTNKMLLYTEYLKAQTRISRVEALLKAPIFYCGLGMPVGALKYKQSFGNQKYEPFKWEGPISISRGKSTFDHSALSISYARPGNAKLTQIAQSDTSEGDVNLHLPPDLNDIGIVFLNNSSDLRNWVFFPTSIPPSVPFCIAGLNDKEMTIKNNMGRSFSISKGDRVHHLRAMTVYAYNDSLYTNDFHAPGAQPRVKGIIDVRFDVDIEKRIVKIYILARGDKIYETFHEIKGKEKWPDEYIKPWIENGSRYQLYASKIVWPLPNLIGSDLICEEFANTTEQF